VIRRWLQAGIVLAETADISVVRGRIRSLKAAVRSGSGRGIWSGTSVGFEAMGGIAALRFAFTGSTETSWATRAASAFLHLRLSNLPRPSSDEFELELEKGLTMTKLPFIAGSLLILGACGQEPYDPRGLRHEETLLSVSATGQAETRPDQAQFQAGISTWEKTAKAASAANLKKIEEIVAALKQLGIPEKDIQTRAVNVQRVDWGDRKGQYQASNIVNVTVRKVDGAGAAVTTVTDAGANIVSGPDLRMAEPEKAANTAYAAAYKAARNRAQAYADAAGMKISRILTIRDSGGTQGHRYLPGAIPAPPPVGMAVEQAAADASNARLMPGQTTSAVAVQVDFALAPQ
jgi:uncharacterized protein YggE